MHHRITQHRTANNDAVRIKVIDALTAQGEMFAAPSGQQRGTGNATSSS